MHRTICAIGLLVAGIAGARVDAGQAPPTMPANFTGPTPPAAPAVVSRDPSGRAVTIRAVRIATPLKIDGKLDEEVYRTVQSISDFVQIEPVEGEPVTQKTEVWILFDSTNFYVVFRCFESNPEKMVANEMRHDNSTITQNDYVNWDIDTFYDRRNGIPFVVNPLGGRMEGQITNERQYNGDYNLIWDLKTGRFDGGWTMEAAIPFKSLRYGPGREQVWGMTILRNNRWKNEIQSVNRMPNSRGSASAFQLSMAPTIVGIEAPPPSKSLEIKPYAISTVTSDRTTSISNDPSADVGIDVKYGITPGITADFTYNTDFAQVEADEQQVNLTRFSLFFPEKREFFLENQGVFYFGGAAGASAGDTPLLFYSRRIGLTGSRIVPIQGGGRVTGRAGRWTIGAIDIRSDREPASALPATNFGVVRVKRDVLRRSSVGVLVADRSVNQLGGGGAQTYGVDGTFAFFTNLLINSYWAKTSSGGVTSDDQSYRGQLDYAADRYGVQAERLSIGSRFNPEAGFVRRTDIDKTFGLFRFSPRPRKSKTVRRYFSQGSVAYLKNGAGREELRDVEGEAAIEYQNSDRLAVNSSNVYEFLPAPFRIAPGVTLPVGGYDYASVRPSYLFGQQRRVTAMVSLEYGTFYDGHKTTFSVSRGRVKVTPQFSLEPTFSINRVTLREGVFTTRLAGSRITYTMTPLMFVSALLQYNSSTNSVASNVRLRWEYRPGSELFVVYNDQRGALGRDVSELQNRALIVKINRLVRF